MLLSFRLSSFLHSTNGAYRAKRYTRLHTGLLLSLTNVPSTLVQELSSICRRTVLAPTDCLSASLNVSGKRICMAETFKRLDSPAL